MALGLRRACRELAFAFPPVLPSRWKHTVGARNALFEARFPARRCLCLRFTRHLTVPSARLEVKMVRYSFLVGLFHPRLHAGFIPTIALPNGRGSARGGLGCSRARLLAFRLLAFWLRAPRYKSEPQ